MGKKMRRRLRKAGERMQSNNRPPAGPPGYRNGDRVSIPTPPPSYGGGDIIGGKRPPMRPQPSPGG